MSRPIIATDTGEWQEIVTGWLYQIDNQAIPRGGFPIAGHEHTACPEHLKNLINYRANRIADLLSFNRFIPALMLYEPDWRIRAMNQLRNKSSTLGVHGYWRLVRFMWESVSVVWPFAKEFSAILADVNERELIMTPSERARLNALPDELVVYRGIGRRFADSGLSWSLSPAVAISYSKKYNGKKYLTATVSKADVAALINLNSGFEVIMAAAPPRFFTSLIMDEE